MAIVDYRNLTGAFDFNNPGVADFASYVGHTPTTYDWLSTNGHGIFAVRDGTGSPIFVNGSNLPVAGTIVSVEIDLNNNNAAAPEIVITGLPNVNLTDLANDDGVNENDDFWTEILAGDTTFVAGSGNVYTAVFDGRTGTNTLELGAAFRLGLSLDFTLINQTNFDLLAFDEDSLPGTIRTIDMTLTEFTSFTPLYSGDVQFEINLQGATNVDLSATTFTNIHSSHVIDFRANGTGAADTIVLPTVDVAALGAFSSMIVAGGGHDVVTGNDGDDTFFGGTGNDTLNGGVGDDTLDGSDGVDILNGGDDNDTLIGGNGSDTLNGGAGDDVINFDGTQVQSVILGGEFDTIDGGANTDIVDFSMFDAAITLGIQSGGLAETFTDGTSQATTLGSNHFADISNVERFVGTSFNDLMFADANISAHFTGGDGNDELTGASGVFTADFLDGGEGNDTIFGNGGLGDELVGSGGNDVIYSGTGLGGSVIRMFGDQYNSPVLPFNSLGIIFITPNTTNTDTSITPGNDTFHHQANESLSWGAEGNDTFFGGSGFFDMMLGGLGDDTFNFGTATVTIAWGGHGADTFEGSVGDDIMNGGRDGDDFDGKGGTDTVTFADQFLEDTVGVMLNLEAGTGTGGFAQGDTYDSIENIVGSRFDDDITGDGEMNNLQGAEGDDVLRGGASNDVLNGGTGADDLFGGTGDDTFVLDDLGDRVFELNGEGTDIVFNSVSYTLSSDVEYMTMTGTGAIDGQGNGLANIIRGNSAGNGIAGGNGGDLLIGNGGNDSLDGQNGVDIMRGGTGSDGYHVDVAGDVVEEDFNGGEFDILRTAVTYTLPDHVEILIMKGGATNPIDGYGNDGVANDIKNLMLGNDSANRIETFGGNDVILGRAGNDRIFGGGGRDNIAGGDGADIITGGAGDDLFNYTNISEAGDIITDFTMADVDVLDLRALFDTFFGGSSLTTQSAQNAGYLTVLQTGSDTAVYVDATGAGDGNDNVLLALLQNTNTTPEIIDNFILV